MPRTGYRSTLIALAMPAATGVLCLTLVGCSIVGPAAISNGRSVYNNAIIKTNDQQTLATIVRLRYGESTGMLAVNSVTANISVSARAGYQAGVGPDSSFEGNLVPLSADIAYEENPTISYTPVDGSQYVTELLAPLRVNQMFLFMSASDEPARDMTALIAAVNDIRNPGFLRGSTRIDHQFARLAELIQQLQWARVIYWARIPEAGNHNVVLLTGYTPAYTDQVREVLELLKIPAKEVDTGDDIVLPVRFAVGSPGEQKNITIRTRSVKDLLDFAAAAVDIPEEHLDSGLARTFPPLGPVKGSIHIHRSEKAPKQAMVAVKHHKWWYYIDENDQVSKHYFQLIQTLLSGSIADATQSDPVAPVLTVPVNR